MKTLKFIESNQNIDKSIESNNEESIYFPLSAVACFELDKKNIKYKIINDYIDWNYVNKKGEENFKLVYELLNKCDEICKNELSKIKDYNLRPFFYNYRIFKHLFDSIFFVKYVLQNIIDKEKSDKIICERLINSKNIVGNNEQSLTYDVLNLLKTKYDFKLKFFEIEIDKKRGIDKNKFNLRQIKSNIYNYLRIIKAKYLNKNKKQVLFINPGYDNIKLFNKLSKNNNFYCFKFRDDYLCGQRPYFTKKQLLELGTKIKLVLEKFNYDDTVKKLLEPYFISYIKNKFSEIVYRYKYILKKFKKINPDYIFTNTGCTDYVNSIYVKFANDLNIKYCVYQHGAYGPNNNPIIIPHDSWNVNYLLLWGKGTKNYFNDKIEEVKDVFKLEKNAEIVVAGSQILRELKNND